MDRRVNGPRFDEPKSGGYFIAILCLVFGGFLSGLTIGYTSKDVRFKACERLNKSKTAVSIIEDDRVMYVCEDR